MARTFNGTNQYLYHNSMVTAYPFTMSCWFRTANTTSSIVMLSISQAGSPNNYWFLDARGDVAGDHLEFHSSQGATGGIAISTNSFSANTWHHALAVATSATSRDVYLDGAGKGSNTTSILPGGLDSFVISGVAISGAVVAQWPGDVAEIAIWSAALTEAEGVALAKGYTPDQIRPASLREYYPCGGHYGQYDLDRWKTKYALTKVGSPTWADHPRVIYPGPSFAPIKAMVASSTKYWNFARQATRIIGGGLGK